LLQDLHKILVKHLPPGVRLTVVFDSCHSGTAMDLPYVYNESGCVDSPSMGTTTQPLARFRIDLLFTLWSVACTSFLL
jgi:hypothetical protein